MKTVKFAFEGSEITFTFDTENKVMVNATEMAKIFNKYPKDFLILETTKSFITEALRKENSPNSNDKNSPNSDYSDDENNAKKRFLDEKNNRNSDYSTSNIMLSVGADKKQREMLCFPKAA